MKPNLFFISAIVTLGGLTATAAPPASLPMTSQVAPQATPNPKLAMDNAAKERARLEDLFIWKASEELKLSAEDETKFTDLIHSLNARRRAANLKMDEALAELTKVKSKSEAEKALSSHRAALKEVQSLQSAEIDRLRPLLGPQKLAQYLVVKNSILEKLKSMLSAPNLTAPQAPNTTDSSSAK